MQRILALSTLVLSGGVLAQQAPASAPPKMYRCGSTYSQTPCASDAAALKVPNGNVASPGQGPRGQALCATEAAMVAGLREPVSVQAMARPRTEVISYADKHIAAVRHEIGVTSEAGAEIAAPRRLICWLSEDQARILRWEATQ